MINYFVKGRKTYMGAMLYTYIYCNGCDTENISFSLRMLSRSSKVEQSLCLLRTGVVAVSEKVQMSEFERYRSWVVAGFGSVKGFEGGWCPTIATGMDARVTKYLPQFRCLYLTK